MDFFKELATDWILFSLIEGFIFCKFFEKVGGLNKIKIYDVLLFSIVTCLISKYFPALFSQLIYTFYIVYFLYIKNKGWRILKIITISLYAMLFMAICEMLIFFIYETVFKVDYSQYDNIIVFLYLIPARIIELLFIFKGVDLMKVWTGGIKR